MEERYTSELRLSVSRARRYALYAGSPRVSAAHLEQAVLHQPLGRACALWLRLGGFVPSDPAALPHPSEEETYPWANDALRLLERAADRRRWMKEELLDSAHVLLAALEDPDSWSSALAREMGRRPEDLLSQAASLDKPPVTEENIQEALEIQRRDGGVLGDILVRLGYADFVELQANLAARHALPIVDLDELEIPPEVIAKVPATMARNYNVVPIKFDGRVLTVAMSNPYDVNVRDDLRTNLRLEIQGAVASEEAVRRALEKYYARQPEKLGPHNADDLVNSAPVVKLLNLILSTAIKARASDIHFEQFEDGCKVRYRVESVLYEMESPPRQLTDAILARLKDWAGLERAIQVPQLGWFTYEGLDIECSVLPTVSGESLVLILPRPPR